ncbi:Acetylcholine receptor subunit beta-like 2 [Hypsibius exemplaris]|uniref:Acetylcholine receptor subunit beta-like 2 n=1 Tax=Hypsibius exemplaris TaxID=2072580 RepID=A0A1W0XDR1_HYPEX|nr:Acetylcholine receptor subunit beta-like 2 [Hypsibius exemplaris]
MHTPPAAPSATRLIQPNYCLILVEYFPYDQQTCKLKFGTWSYDADQINLIPLHGYDGNDSTIIHNGIDLSDFYTSIEWDVMSVSAKRSETVYPCCVEKYIDITYTFSIRRKTMYFTVNLIIPCVAISFLTVLVFYLPSDSGEKITLSISVLMSLTVFFLLLAENVPPTSLAVPLIGKYLVFTMVLVTLSTMISVAVLDIHFRHPSTHYKMPAWIRWLFIEVLPPIIRVNRPLQYAPKVEHKTRVQKEREKFLKRSTYSSTTIDSEDNPFNTYNETSFDTESFVLESSYSPEVERAIESVKFIADKFRDNKKQENSIQDWKYVARVIDRFFLVLFGFGCIFGTFAIILNAPSLYDDRRPIPYTKCTNSTDFSQLPGYKPEEEAFLRSFICSRAT